EQPARLGLLFLLCREGAGGVDRRELILADAAGKQFLHACLGVEVRARAVLYERERKRPVLRADVKHRGAVGLAHQAMHFVELARELLALTALLGRSDARDELVVRVEDPRERSLVVAADSLVEGAA